MKVGELFVDLGIKGAEQTGKAIGGVREGLTGARNNALKATAAIGATVFALERMMSSSAQLGTGLTQFNDITGLSIKQLQEYQNAGRKVGITNEAVKSSFQGVQQTLADAAAGRTQIEGFGTVASVLGDFDIDRAKDDVAYAIQELQKFAQKENDVVLRNVALRSFGLNDEMISGLVQNAFTAENFKGANILGQGEAERLREVGAIWSDLRNDISVTMARGFAENGVEIASQVKMVADSIFRLIESMRDLNSNLGIIEKIGKIAEGWAMLIDSINSGIKKLEERGAIGATEDAVSATGEASAGLVNAIIGDSAYDSLNSFLNAAQANIKETLGGSFVDQIKKEVEAKNVGRIPQSVGGAQINQEFNFNNNGENAQQVASDVKRASQEVYRQMNLGEFN